MLQVHDNTCFGYRFSGEESRLILETEFPDGTPRGGQQTDIIFDGVWCHHIESIQDGNIIFDIEETDLKQMRNDFSELFKRLENYGWPPEEKKDEPIEELIRRKNLKVFRIGSSYGMIGFVVAESVTQTNSEQSAPLDGDSAGLHPCE